MYGKFGAAVFRSERTPTPMEPRIAGEGRGEGNGGVRRCFFSSRFRMARVPFIKPTARRDGRPATLFSARLKVDIASHRTRFLRRVRRNIVGIDNRITHNGMVSMMPIRRTHSLSPALGENGDTFDLLACKYRMPRSQIARYTSGTRGVNVAQKEGELK